MSVYCYILGGGPDSKLFKNVREKHSLCYNISCFHRPVTNTMIITAGVNKEDVKFLAESAMADACCPGNPKNPTLEDIIKLYE